MVIHELREGDWPDVTNGVPCCMGHAIYGPGGCTCWQPVFDLEQRAPRTDLTAEARRRPCADCAYRAGSPERSGDKGYKGDADMLRDLASTGEPFWCHQGMRRVVEWRHPSGATIPGHPAQYSPEIAGNTPYKADGTPAELCGGWSILRAVARG